MSFSSHVDQATLAILPHPNSIVQAEGYFQITRSTVIFVDHQTQAIGALLAEMLAPALGFSLSVLVGSPVDQPALVLRVGNGLASGTEGYVLTVTPQQIMIRGASPTGVFYGVQTLRQLLPSEIFSTTPVEQEWNVPVVTIEDEPRFTWRGLMLDTARHFIPKSEIIKFIDLLALHKMNMLHLHLTDDQGWRIEIKKYPNLTRVGAYRKETVVGHASRPQGYDGKPHGGFYTQEDLRELVAYAAARFVTIVPEIEIPGHAMSSIAAYPELGVTGQAIEVGTTWGVMPYLYNPTENTLHFLYDVLSEVMDVFPGQFIHIGGDEAVKGQWETSAQVQNRIKELGLRDEHELQSWFISQMGMFLEQHGRRLIGWDEILEGGLPAGATVMSWRGIVGGISAAQANHDVVMSPTTHAYLDYYQTNDPEETLSIGGYLPLDTVYSFNPLPAELTSQQARHILGVQGNIWTEYIPTVERLEYMTFPRAIALAEVAWTQQSRRDFASFLQRLAVHEARLRALNVTFRSVATWDQEATFPRRKYA